MDHWGLLPLRNVNGSPWQLGFIDSMLFGCSTTAKRDGQFRSNHWTSFSSSCSTQRVWPAQLNASCSIVRLWFRLPSALQRAISASLYSHISRHRPEPDAWFVNNNQASIDERSAESGFRFVLSIYFTFRIPHPVCAWLFGRLDWTMAKWAIDIEWITTRSRFVCRCRMQCMNLHFSSLFRW